MTIEVVMPFVTEEGVEAVVTAWFVDEGSRVKRDQLIAEVQAEKVSMEVEAPQDGVVNSIVAAINEPVLPGSVICLIEEAGEAQESPVSERGGDGDTDSPEPDIRVVASPSARRVAAELGVDLATVAGTGPDRRITEDDVRAAVAPPGLTGMRAVIARNMRESHRTTAPVTLTTTVDLDDGTDRIIARVVKATAMAVADHPQLNGTREGDLFTPASEASVAVAIQTEEGLVAPVIEAPATLTIETIADQIADLAKRARARGLTTADYQGGTFTVTNLGGYGIDGFTPIINLPQVAILGIGAVRKVPAYDAEGSVVPRSRLTLSLTFDHAFVDGAPAAEFLASVRDLLETID